MGKNSFYNPVRTIQGKGTLEDLPELVKTIGGVKKILILAWNDSVYDLQAIQKIINSKNYQVIKAVFSDKNPTVHDLLTLYQESKDENIDLIIGVGGGSVMDLSKSLCMLYEHDAKTIEDIRSMIENKAYATPSTKWIGIPTTAGTGSEVTCWATIWDPTMDLKRSIHSDKNYAFAAIVDPNLVYTQPIATAIGSAIDAVAQAMEAYWSKKTNMVTRSLALTAMEKIMTNLDDLLDGDLGAYDEICQGSLMSGLSFSNTQTTACHAISYPLTMRYDIPHGVAVGLLLAPVMYHNEEQIIDKVKFFEALGVKSTDELSLEVQNKFEAAQIPSSLSGWGVKEEDLEEMTSLANTPGIFDNNPKTLSREDVMDILKRAF